MLLIVPEGPSRVPTKHLKSGSDQVKRFDNAGVCLTKKKWHGGASVLGERPDFRHAVLEIVYLSQMTVVEGQPP